MNDCFEVLKNDLEDLSNEGCASLFSNFHSNRRFQKAKEETFKFNAKFRKKFFKGDPFYPECPEQDSWNSVNIREAIKDWKASIFDKEDLHWFHDSSKEPLDPFNPRLNLTFDQLAGRKIFGRRMVTI